MIWLESPNLAASVWWDVLIPQWDLVMFDSTYKKELHWIAILRRPLCNLYFVIDHLYEKKVEYRSDPTDHQSRPQLNSRFTFGVLLWVCFLKICAHSAITKGLIGVYFWFTQGLFLGIILCTEVWSRTVFHLTVISLVIPASCIFQIHM